MTNFRKGLRGEKKLRTASTWEITCFLYQRHEIEFLYGALALTYTMAMLRILGVF